MTSDLQETQSSVEKFPSVEFCSLKAKLRALISGSAFRLCSDWTLEKVPLINHQRVRKIIYFALIVAEFIP